VLANKDEFSHRQYIFKNILTLSDILHIDLSEKPNFIAADNRKTMKMYPLPEQADKLLGTFFDVLESHLNP
jgi:hypothetical protein